MKKKEEKSQTDKSEILKKLLKDAEKIHGLQLGLPLDADDSEDLEGIETMAGLQDPEKSHSLYYTLRGLLTANLPKGKEVKEVREFVYEEINLFLNRGKQKDPATGIRGSDARQAYTHHLEEALFMVEQWIREGANAYNAFIMFRDKNIEKGYRKTSDL